MSGERHISCQDVVNLITDYLEDSLEPEARSVFEEHLNFCDGCVWYVDQMHETIEHVGQLREEHVPPEALDRLMTAFRDFEVK